MLTCIEYLCKWDISVFHFQSICKHFEKHVFTLSLSGIVWRWVREKNVSGCNNKCGISQRVWILSEGTVCVAYLDNGSPLFPFSHKWPKPQDLSQAHISLRESTANRRLGFFDLVKCTLNNVALWHVLLFLFKWVCSVSMGIFLLVSPSCGRGEFVLITWISYQLIEHSKWPWKWLHHNTRQPLRVYLWV